MGDSVCLCIQCTVSKVRWDFDGNSAAFSLEFGNGEFSGPELKKIMANEKLAEIALIDPKRAKRCVDVVAFDILTCCL